MDPVMANENPFKLSQIFIPVSIGLVVVVWLFLREFDPKTLWTLRFNYTSVACVFLAFLLMLGRDFGMIWRFRLMADKKISWHQAFNIHILSEFTSAVTPSAVGGSGLVVLFMNKEGLSVGRSTAIMFAGLIMDELFFIVVTPIIFLFVPMKELFNATSVVASTISVIYWTVYAGITIWTLILIVGLFFRPDMIAGLMQLIFRLPFLNRWHDKIKSFGSSIVESSKELGQRSKLFWLKIGATTLLTWASRFLVVNALFMAFVPVNNQLIIFGRQLILWLVMLVSPTPGGSGLSEFAFKEYYSDIVLSTTPVLLIIILWRFISYYFYLLVGTVVVPRWLRGKFKRRREYKKH
ncbi:MAG: lysylphosphatidylglycerol synthase transmembrane domain-containing protein [Paludibacter sp.]|nr:lysylphosphatidylglycerol synthase transmembrane domain-containing protein [Paludibacter sp.]